MKIINDYIAVNIAIPEKCSEYLFTKNTNFISVTKFELESYCIDDHILILKQIRSAFEAILKEGYYLGVASNIIGLVGAAANPIKYFNV